VPDTITVSVIIASEAPSLKQLKPLAWLAGRNPYLAACISLASSVCGMDANPRRSLIRVWDGCAAPNQRLCRAGCLGVPFGVADLDAWLRMFDLPRSIYEMCVVQVSVTLLSVGRLRATLPCYVVIRLLTWLSIMPLMDLDTASFETSFHSIRTKVGLIRYL
jgi:hypothetical protein